MLVNCRDFGLVKNSEFKSNEMCEKAVAVERAHGMTPLTSWSQGADEETELPLRVEVVRSCVFSPVW